MRIVSLLPSATEIICALELTNQLVGITHECDYPSSVVGLPTLTESRISVSATSAAIDTMVREQLTDGRSLYTLKHETLQSLAPDLIVTQTLCSVCAVAEDEVKRAVARLPHPVEVLNLEPQTWDDVVASFRQVARAAGAEPAADRLLAELQGRLDRVAAAIHDRTERPSVVFLEWLDPPFSSGHWTPELVRMAGARECLASRGERSRTLSWEEVRRADPDYLVVACCGFSVARTLEDVRQLSERAEWRSLRAVREGNVIVVDGSQYFSRPGPRLVDSVEVLAHSLFPGSIELPDGIEPAVRLGAG